MPATWIVRDKDLRGKEFGDACDEHLGTVAGELHIDELSIEAYIFPRAN
jgi:hypothetical protein